MGHSLTPVVADGRACMVGVQETIQFLSDFVWPNGNPELREMCALAACHLACGRVNSARMVQEGITPMLTFLATSPNDDDEHNYGLRCASALRNLLLVNANHERMVRDGVIQAIVRLFYSDDTMTKQHCAAALRNITYNHKFRRLLVDSGAISVIIEDSKMEDEEDEEDLPLTINLLFEIEAESWTNGSRGRHPEGRAPPIPPMPLFTKLLDGFDPKPFVVPTEVPAELYKVPAELAQTAEPPLDLSSDYTAKSFYSSNGSAGGVKGARDHDIDFKTHVMVGGKVEVPPEGLAVLKDAEVKTAAGTTTLEAARQPVKKRESSAAVVPTTTILMEALTTQNVSGDVSAVVAAANEVLALERPASPGSGNGLPPLPPAAEEQPTKTNTDSGTIDRMFSALGQAVSDFNNQNSNMRMSQDFAALLMEKPGTADSRGTGGRRSGSSAALDLGEDGNGVKSKLIRSATINKARDHDIDMLIETFKRSKTVESLLQTRKKSLADEAQKKTTRRLREASESGRLLS